MRSRPLPYDKWQQVNFRVSRDLVTEVDQVASAMNLTRNQFIQTALAHIVEDITLRGRKFGILESRR